MRDFHYFKTLINPAPLPQPMFSKFCEPLVPSTNYLPTAYLTLLGVVQVDYLFTLIYSYLKI